MELIYGLSLTGKEVIGMSHLLLEFRQVFCSAYKNSLKDLLVCI